MILQRKTTSIPGISPTQAERRTTYIADLSPTVALALVSQTSPRASKTGRDYLQRHIINRAYFGVSTHAGFAFEFHLPYFVLRENATVRSDVRGLRQSRPASAVPTDRFDHVHQAQISVLLTGVDEWIWTVTCCVDSYFESDDPIDDLSTLNLDAPTGGETTCDKPIWNPREYFLVIVANRIRQVTREWANIICEFENRLSKFVSPQKQACSCG